MTCVQSYQSTTLSYKGECERDRGRVCKRVYYLLTTIGIYYYSVTFSAFLTLSPSLSKNRGTLVRFATNRCNSRSKIVPSFVPRYGTIGTNSNPYRGNPRSHPCNPARNRVYCTTRNHVPMPRIPTETIVAHAEAGCTLAEISALTGLHPSAISRRLKGAGVKTAQGEQDPRVAKAQRIFAMTPDANPRTVAEACGIHLATSYRAKRRAEIAQMRAQTA
jgi:hypothetical protein